MPLDSSNPRNLNKTPVYTNHFYCFPWERIVKTERDDTLAWRIVCLGSPVFNTFGSDMVFSPRDVRFCVQGKASTHTSDIIRSCRFNCADWRAWPFYQDPWGASWKSEWQLRGRRVSEWKSTRACWSERQGKVSRPETWSNMNISSSLPGQYIIWIYNDMDLNMLGWLDGMVSE